VSSRPEDEALELRVVRGTTVLDDHEAAMTDLCANPDSSDEEVEQCVLDYIQSGYYYEDPSAGSNEELCDTHDNNCALGDLHNLWAGDLLPVSVPKEAADTKKDRSQPAVKPWSSRVSPSGTYVRDPATGEMRNIDS
jgi:hypothetical protein